MAIDEVEPVLGMMRDVMDENIVGVYLHGSAVLGGLRPRSDLDVMVVSRRRTCFAEKQRLVAELLALSGHPRNIELTIVVESEIRPWRYPPRMDFQYGDWWRGEFERGEMNQWPEMNPDLASLIRMVLIGNAPLLGPPPREIFEPVPRRDYIDALLRGIDGLLQDIESDTTNVVLTLARIWSGVVTDEVHSKDAAADWVIRRLPAQHRPILAMARGVYLGDDHDDWHGLHERVAAYADHVVAEIERLPDVDPASE